MCGPSLLRAVQLLTIYYKYYKYVTMSVIMHQIDERTDLTTTQAVNQYLVHWNATRQLNNKCVLVYS